MAPSRQVLFGFGATIGASTLATLLHALLPAPPPILLQQLLMTVASIGVQLVFPVLTLRVLDMFPAIRGTAASAQTFVQLIVASSMIGVVVPMLHGALSWLTLGSALAGLLSLSLWRGAARFARGRAEAFA